MAKSSGCDLNEIHEIEDLEETATALSASIRSLRVVIVEALLELDADIE